MDIASKKPACIGVEIFSYYESVAIEKVKGKNAIVLKTDLHNESEQQKNNKNILKAIYPYIDHGYGLEIDVDVYKDALAVMQGYNRLDLLCGDIRKIPLYDDTVDILLDFSTIDHVIEYEDALKEYKRVVKPSGELLIIVWLTQGPSRQDYIGQYSFNQKRFEDKLRKYYEIEYSKLLLVNGVTVMLGGRELIEYGLSPL